MIIWFFQVTRFFAHTVVGTVPTIVPLVFAAFPFVARLVDSLREVDGNIIETAVSMGASPLQIIFRVLIRRAFSLISNITIALTTVLSYSAMSGIIGGGGLGKIAINYGYYRSEEEACNVHRCILTHCASTDIPECWNENGNK